MIDNVEMNIAELMDDVEACGDIVILAEYYDEQILLLYRDNDDNKVYCVVYNIVDGYRKRVSRTHIITVAP